MLPVELRDYWKDEAREFTPWLASEENLRLLGEAIGFELELEGIEIQVGAFKADIVAKELETQNRVLIENQLERTDHDHLGKLITYASGLNASAVIWIAAEINDEHRRALDWLNDITGKQCAFFGIEIELWRIGASDPAPKFNLVSHPNDWFKTLAGRGENDALTETQLLNEEFWRAFGDFAKTKGTKLRLRKPRLQHWYPIPIGHSRFYLSLTASTKKRRLGCELYIRKSKLAFGLLRNDKEPIEREIGVALEWQDLPRKQDCRIAQYRPGDISDREAWPEFHAWLLERAEVFYRVFSKRVRELNLEGEDLEEDETLPESSN